MTRFFPCKFPPASGPHKHICFPTAGATNPLLQQLSALTMFMMPYDALESKLPFSYSISREMDYRHQSHHREFVLPSPAAEENPNCVGRKCFHFRIFYEIRLFGRNQTRILEEENSRFSNQPRRIASLPFNIKIPKKSYIITQKLGAQSDRKCGDQKEI